MAYDERMLRVVSIEADPWTFVHHEDTGLEATLDPEIDGFARYVLERLEAYDAECNSCKKSIGHVLEVREDTYGAETEVCVWRWVIIVQDNAEPRYESAFALCEECGAGVLS